MALVSNRYGKGRVRVMRVRRDGGRHDVSELSIEAMVTGAFASAYTDADNSACVSTDTIKNVVHIVARESLDTSAEAFCAAVADRLLGAYRQVDGASVTARETRWTRMAIGGAPHPHAFTLDGNGTPFATVRASRDGSLAATSGVDGLTFLKTTESGWADFAKDPFTTLKETRDRLCATSMTAEWTWRAAPADHSAANASTLAVMLEVFATTYSASVQDSLYRMGEAALAAVPEIGEMRLACPNKHYLPIDLTPFGIDNGGAVFLPTDEPHGQIECVVGRA